MTTALFFQFYSNAFTKDVNQLNELQLFLLVVFLHELYVFRPECIHTQIVVMCLNVMDILIKKNKSNIWFQNFIFWFFEKSHSVISILDGTIIWPIPQILPASIRSRNNLFNFCWIISTDDSVLRLMTRCVFKRWICLLKSCTFSGVNLFCGTILLLNSFSWKSTILAIFSHSASTANQK